MAKLELPSNLEAERSVLGLILTSPEVSAIALDTLKQDDFSDADPRNKILFKAMEELYIKHCPIDAQTVINELISLKLDKAFGDLSYLYDLVSGTFDLDHYETYIDMVKEQSLLRELLLKVNDIQTEYSKGVSDIGEFITASNSAISAISAKRAVGNMLSASDAANMTYDKIIAMKSNDGLTGINTGYPSLNKYTHGWQPGELIIVAARPGMGKTAFALNLAFNGASKSDVPVAFFSLEMSTEKIMERMLSSRSNVPSEKLSTGFNLRNDDKVMLKNARDEIAATRLYFDDTPNSKLGDILSKATKLKSKHPDLGLVVIDYLSRIKLSDKVSGDINRTIEIGEITGSLKTLARNLKIPVICLAQLNRNAENTDSKIPSLANLRESGNIEQDADMVLMLYREDYYTDIGQKVKSNPWSKKPEGEQPQPEPEKKTNNVMSDTKVIIAKNRNGQTGKVTLLFQKDISLFIEPSPSYLSEQENLNSSLDE